MNHDIYPEPLDKHIIKLILENTSRVPKEHIWLKEPEKLKTQQQKILYTYLLVKKEIYLKVTHLRRQVSHFASVKLPVLPPNNYADPKVLNAIIEGFHLLTKNTQRTEFLEKPICNLVYQVEQWYSDDQQYWDRHSSHPLRDFQKIIGMLSTERTNYQLPAAFCNRIKYYQKAQTWRQLYLDIGQTRLQIIESLPIFNQLKQQLIQQFNHKQIKSIDYIYQLPHPDLWKIPDNIMSIVNKLPETHQYVWESRIMNLYDKDTLQSTINRLTHTNPNMDLCKYCQALLLHQKSTST